MFDKTKLQVLSLRVERVECITLSSFSAISTKLTILKALAVTICQMKKPTLEIEFCTQCRWLLRAAWLAQELLTTFDTDLQSVNLVPGTGGILEVRCDGEVLFSRAKAGRFPEAKELKQLLRDRIDPARSLGHSDSPVRALPAEDLGL